MILLLITILAAGRNSKSFVVWGIKKELLFLCQMVVGVGDKKVTPSI